MVVRDWGKGGRLSLPGIICSWSYFLGISKSEYQLEFFSELLHVEYKGY